MKIGNQTYLLRGMCSNGPEVGIVPHKSLLETSLKRKKNQRTNHSYRAIEHKTFEVEMYLHNFETRYSSQFPWDWPSQTIPIEPPTKHTDLLAR